MKEKFEQLVLDLINENDYSKKKHIRNVLNNFIAAVKTNLDKTEITLKTVMIDDVNTYMNNYTNPASVDNLLIAKDSFKSVIV